LKLGLDQLLLNVKLNQDSAFFNINWYNLNTEALNKGKINGLAALKNTDKIDVFLENADMVIYDSVWSTTNNGHLTLIDNDLVFDSLEFRSAHQSVLINGAISDTLDESFLMQFKNFNISTLNILTAQAGLAFKGFLTGSFELIDVYNNINFLANLKLVDFTLNEEHLGDAEIKSTWNTDRSVFLNINLEKQGSKGSFKPLYLEGFYYPEEIDNQIDMDVSVHNLSINFLNPFLKEFVSDLEGRATGEIRLKGNFLKPNLSGRLDLARTQFRIKYLNTLYSLSGTLNLDNEMLGFNEVVLFDTVGNKAVLQGGLSHERLRNFGVNLKVKPINFVALNTSKGMNELFYGKAIVDGEIAISGPFDNVFLDIDATSKNGTNISIPINTSLGVSDNSFIVFKNSKDTTEAQNAKQFKPKLSSFSLNMDLSITPEANVNISLPSQLGLIQAQGSGDLNMNLSRTGNFRMSGDYRVSNGVFFFKIRNLLNRRFVLNEGGTISWTGDPYNGTLGMTAKYTVKTSLNSLGLDQDSSYRNRVPVDCMIGLTGPIMNPNVKFRFDLPNSTEEVKQYVFTKIDTTNPSEMSQQMLSLLVLNTFSFTTGTGNSDLANTVGGTSLQIVANQVSNWLSQISKDVDIGINYRPGGDLTNEEVEVALSTQLFDERVTIDGNFGYQNVQDNPNTANTSSIVGDINVEVKITKDGRLRLKAFNRTNTVDLLDNTSPYTQGVGIFYRKEFNNLEELFQNQKRRERKKQEEEKNKAELNAVKNEEDGVKETPQ
ncbi:translocation/assembly module TamB, partial [Lentimicrobium sp. L6]